MAARPNFTIGGWLQTQFIRRDTIGCHLHRHARCSVAANASATAVIATMPDPSRATAIALDPLFRCQRLEHPGATDGPPESAVRDRKGKTTGSDRRSADPS